MRLIKKGKEPNSLTEYKKQSNAYFDGCNKSDIRKELLTEQGYLCAYCMKRISEDEMKIEHYYSQSKIKEKEALDYNYMLGVCLGNANSEGAKKKANLTCDSHRGNDELKINPYLQSSIDLISYKDNGIIFSNDPEINKDLNETLNLNCERAYLVINRKRSLDVLKKKLHDIKSKGTWKKDLLEKIKKKYEEPDENGKLVPYSGIILYYLNKRLDR